MRIISESNRLRSKDESTSPGLSDEILASQVAGGSDAALEALYDRYSSMVLGFTLRMLGDRGAAEDVLQETFWRVWKNASTFQPQRGSFASWLFRIARNLAIDVHRRGTVRPQLMVHGEETAAMEQVHDPGIDVAQQAQAAIENSQVRLAMTSLPVEQRQVLEMAYFQGMTRQEISETTGEPLGTIHTRARLALQKLREELERLRFEG
jgi:RNA polymerase sigma-70 factor (ECF subfamily)